MSFLYTYLYISLGDLGDVGIFGCGVLEMFVLYVDCLIVVVEFDRIDFI